MRFILIILLFHLSTVATAQDQDIQLVEHSACSFLNSIRDMDYAQAKDYGTKNTAQMLEMMASFTSMMPDSVKEEAKKIRFEITEIQVKGAKAKIKFFGSDAPDKSEEIILVNKNGQWLVDMELPQPPSNEDQEFDDIIIEEEY